MFYVYIICKDVCLHVQMKLKERIVYIHVLCAAQLLLLLQQQEHEINYVYLYTYLYTYIYTCMYDYVYTYIHTYPYTHIYTHKHAHTHTDIEHAFVCIHYRMAKTHRIP